MFKSCMKSVCQRGILGMKQFQKLGDQSFRKYRNQEGSRDKREEFPGGVAGTWSCWSECNVSVVPPNLMYLHVRLIQSIDHFLSSVQLIDCSEYKKKCLFLEILLIIISQRKQNFNTIVITKNKLPSLRNVENT